MPNKLKCDKCGHAIPKTSKFCPQCGDPVTEADLIDNQVERTEKIRLVCPKCKSQRRHDCDLSNQPSMMVCPKCEVEFKSHVTQIRSASSRGSKKDNRRSYTIRVKEFTGNENLIEFEDASYEKFELRSKDLVAFNYLNGTLKVVQNLTVNKYATISKPWCFIASCIYGAQSTEVSRLRIFRDTHLLDTNIGTSLVTLYYKISPFFVRKFGSNKVILYISKRILNLFLKTIVK